MVERLRSEEGKDQLAVITIIREKQRQDLLDKIGPNGMERLNRQNNYIARLKQLADRANFEASLSNQRKIKPPFPGIESYLPTATILSYYGMRERVIDLMQVLSRQSRIYARSHHRGSLKSFLKARDWNKNGGPPAFLKGSSINATRSHDKNEEFCSMILKAWNNSRNTNLTMVCQELASMSI